jgi:hypothetical protein
LLQSLPVQRRGPGQELVQKHAEGIDVATRIDVELVELRLLGAHVFERADDGPKLREQCLLRELGTGCLDNAEVDHLGHRLRIVDANHDVGWFDITVDDALVVGVLDRLTDRDE